MSQKRLPNLNSKEKEAIINIALKYKNIIENKRTDNVSLTNKDKIWTTIETEFNSTSNIKRNKKQLKAFYQNSKYNLKKEISAYKSEMYKTGGGPQAKKLDENNPMIAVIEKETTPLRNDYDSSSDFFATSFDELDSANDITEKSSQQLFITEFVEESESSKENTIAVEENFPAKSTPHQARKRTATYAKHLDEIAELKKQKLVAQIEKNKAKTLLYEKKLEILKQIEEEKV